MGAIIEQHLEAALAHYSQNEYYEVMLEAKKLYLELTGSVDDSEADYENKMNSFNDWYLLQYTLPGKKCTVMEDYLQSSLPGRRGCRRLQKLQPLHFSISGEKFSRPPLHQRPLGQEKNRTVRGHPDNPAKK